MILTQTDAPVAYPVSLDEAKENGRISHDAEDALISALIASATAAVEQITGRAFCTQYWQATMDAWEDEIVIPMGPASVTLISYLDADGAEQTVADTEYTVDSLGADCRIAPVGAWPTAQETYNAITIEFAVGASVAPPQIKQAILLLVQHWFENRGAVADAQEMPLGVQWLVGMNRRMWV